MKFTKIYLYSLFTILYCPIIFAQTGQIAVPRIETMPNLPAPYNLRNWKQVARQYDSFVYDVTKTGQYLPLTKIGNAGVNYPQNKTIIMSSYVGSPGGSEAINVLPSLVSASLVGIDKSNQFGQNWLLMSQDFFNKANGENIYLNNAGAKSGGDWWYDVMPNVFFYQLFSLYPNLGGEANTQFITIADQFLKAVKAMGGNDAPWTIPNMNYRAWKFATSQGNAAGVHEPEAAGAMAWVLYNAYKKTGNKDYLKGAQWAMEFFNGLQTNPSYELQLPYGTYTAAKMNAELGTTYDVQKMVNWSFDKGPLRGWGTIVGTWGGFDVSGLVGEANDAGNDYAFQLNAVQQAGQLVPMVRYDKRFARAIGKWVLNLANATRLYYPGFLPSNLQDATAWSNAYDPNQVIGYEALRQVWQGQSPFSTGDALKGGWAGTNLSLYSTSSIGYLGAIVEVTNVEKILKLNLTKTDFFGAGSYPTFLIFNPYSSSQTIAFDAGNSLVDLYDAATETFILKNVSGSINLPVLANQALIVTLTPANGKITYDKNRMLVNNVVADYMQTKNAYTHTAYIKALAADKMTISITDSTNVYATAFDPDGGNISYKWSSDKGTISGTGAKVVFHPSTTVGDAVIQLIITDLRGNSDTSNLKISVVGKINYPPIINDITGRDALNRVSTYTTPGGKTQFTCNASDPNNDVLTYTWSADGGTFSGIDKVVTWTAPTTEGIYKITCKVTDTGNLSVQSATSILVKNFSNTTGNLIAYYPFSGTYDDVSGNQLNGVGTGTLFINDRNGVPGKACYFNGGTQNVSVAASPVLNFQNAITVSAWFSAYNLPADRETFLLSHGSWQNRWKISFTPDRYLRWTVNTLSGIADLDTPFPFVTDSFYHVTVTYDGALIAIYINSNLVSYKNLSGKIRTTTLAFMMGQILPTDATYNFKGIIDEVKIFDYALSPTATAALYQQSLTAVNDIIGKDVALQRLQISPNPVANELRITIKDLQFTNAQLRVFDLIGRVILEKKIRFETGSAHLDVSALTSGIYLLTFVNDNLEMSITKFIKL